MDVSHCRSKNWFPKPQFVDRRLSGKQVSPSRFWRPSRLRQVATLRYFSGRLRKFLKNSGLYKKVGQVCKLMYLRWNKLVGSIEYFSRLFHGQHLLHRRLRGRPRCYIQEVLPVEVQKPKQPRFGLIFGIYHNDVNELLPMTNEEWTGSRFKPYFKHISLTADTSSSDALSFVMYAEAPAFNALDAYCSRGCMLSMTTGIC